MIECLDQFFDLDTPLKIVTKAVIIQKLPNLMKLANIRPLDPEEMEGDPLEEDDDEEQEDEND
jgi:hypothetical protein